MMFPKLRTLIQNNPDYFGAVVTSYGTIALQIAAQILLVPLYLEFLGKYLFGVFSLLIASVAVASLTVSWGYGSVLRILGPAVAHEDEEEFSRGYAAARWLFVGYAIILAGVVTVVVGALSPWLLADVDAGSRAEIYLAAFLAAVYFVVQMDLSVDQMALNVRRMQTVANKLIIVGLIVFVVLVIPWLWNGGGIAGVFGCLVVSSLCVRAVVFVYWRRHRVRLGWRRLTPDLRASIKQYLDQMREGYLAYSLVFAVLQADIAIVGFLGGAELSAEFFLIWKVAEISILLLSRLSESLQPELVHSQSRGDEKRIGRIFARGVWLVRGIGLATGATYALLGHWAVHLWVGNAAPDNWVAFALAGSAIAWLGAARFPAIFAYALGHLRPLVRVAALELTAKLLLTFVLFSRFGILAPLIAINVTHLCGIAWAYRALPRH